MAELLHLDGLVKRFGGLTATDGVTLDVTEGEIHALIGPNGAGKTTLIHQIAGSLAPDAGRIRFNGVDVTRMSLHLRTQLGLARSYQVVSLFRRLSVRDNLAFAVQARTGSTFRFWRSGAPRAAAVRRSARLAEARRAGRPQRPPAARSRTANSAPSRSAWRSRPVRGCCCSTSRSPALGPEESERMVDLIAGLPGSHCTLLVEHDMDAVFRLADRVSVLVNGRVIATGTADELSARPSRGARAYLGDDVAVHDCMSALLEVERLEAAYGPSAGPFGLDLSIAGRRGRDAARPQRHGQDDDDPRASGPRDGDGRQHPLRGDRIDGSRPERIAPCSASRSCRKVGRSSRT
jgi:branched-chain amino acid transport system ATP-binding protein